MADTENSEKLHYHNHKSRLRNRYEQDGLDGFLDYEVLELLLSYSLVRKDTKNIAKALIEKFGNIVNVFNAEIGELCSIDGISERSAVLLKLVRDAGVYFRRYPILNSSIIKCSQDVYEYLKMHYKGLKNEEFKVLFLNSRNIIIKEETLFRGTVNEAKIYIRILTEKALKYGASAVILVHNHPGGTMQASTEDIDITIKIKKYLKMIDVKVLDHIIVGDDSYLSLAEERKI